MAAYYKKHDEEETALKTVLEGLDKADGRLDEIYEYLFRYYEKNKNEAALESLYEKSEKRNSDQDTIVELMNQYYQKCRQELSDLDFREEAAILSMIKKRNRSIYFDILMDRGETREIIEYITQHQQYRGWGLDQGHYFSKRLSGEYPREVVDMYWKKVTFYVSLGKEKDYGHAVKVLKEIRTIMKRNKWMDEWNGRYKTFLEEHRRKNCC